MWKQISNKNNDRVNFEEGIVVDEKSTTLCFYPSKIKSILIIIFGFVFLVVGVVMFYDSFKRGEYFLSLVGGVAAIFLALSIPLMIIRIIKSLPYLVLTDKELIMYPGTKNAIPVKWEDIDGYHIRTIHLKYNTLIFIEIILHDEEKYKAQMSGLQRKLNVVGTMGGNFALFAIPLSEIKSAERDLLLYALDNFTSPDFDMENVPKSREEKKMDSFLNQINHYFKRSYLFSLVMTVLLALFLYSSLDEVHSLIYVITSFILFPFAKFILDVLIIYDLKSTIESKSNSIKKFYQLISSIIYFFLFFMSPIIGALGLVYFIMVVIRRWIKKEK